MNGSDVLVAVVALEVGHVGVLSLGVFGLEGVVLELYEDNQTAALARIDARGAGCAVNSRRQLRAQALGELCFRRYAVLPHIAECGSGKGAVGFHEGDVGRGALVGVAGQEIAGF